MAIQQHPLPQDISSYRFRLIGDMTIKQFASLAISIIVAIIVYGLPLPFFFKYPLTFLFVMLGVGMAFVPFQGRTLDVWIIAFIKSIYTPTLFSWKKTAAEDINPDTIAPSEANSRIAAPTVSNAVIEITKGGTPASTSTPAITPEPQSSTESAPVTPIPETPPTTSVTANTADIASQAEIPQPPPVTPPRMATSSTPSVAEKPSEPTPAPKTPLTTAKPSAPTPNTSNLPIPFTPTTPNTLVGLTINKDNRIIDGVLVEIKKNGLTIRATKSNKLGQFMFARPLENGTFQILAEKDSFTFTNYSLELTGEIIRPLKIQAQN